MYLLTWIGSYGAPLSRIFLKLEVSNIINMAHTSFLKFNDLCDSKKVKRNSKKFNLRKILCFLFLIILNIPINIMDSLVFKKYLLNNSQKVIINFKTFFKL